MLSLLGPVHAADAGRNKSRAARKHKSRSRTKKAKTRNKAKTRTDARQNAGRPAVVRHIRDAADLRAAPGETSEVIVVLAPDTEVRVIGRDGRWMKVEARGFEGWVTRTSLATVGASRRNRPTGWRKRATSQWSESDRRSAPSSRDDADDDRDASAASTVRASAALPPAPTHAVRVSVGIGYESLGLDFSSDLDAGLGNYVIAVDAATAAAEADARYMVAGRFVVGADARYRIAVASPGIRYAPAEGEPADISFSSHHADAEAVAGLRLGDATSPIDIVARAGYHYEALLVDQLDNPGRLPSESLAGPTLGLGVTALRVGDTVTLDAEARALVAGTRRQTERLEDGELASATATWIRVAASIPLEPRWWLTLDYRDGRATTRWSGASARVPDASNSERADTSRILMMSIRHPL